jgi:hypothetical protein
MKTQTNSKAKLSLNKRTIVLLNEQNIGFMNGGGEDTTVATTNPRCAQTQDPLMPNCNKPKSMPQMRNTVMFYVTC